MTLSILANISDVITVPISLIGVLLVVKQLVSSRNERREEFIVRRKEITLNAYNHIRDDLRDLSASIRDELHLVDMFAIITDKELKSIIHNKKLENKIRKMLSIFERFAVGVKHEIYCSDMIKDLSGTVFSSSFYQFKPYIEYVREKEKRLYINEFENLVNKMKVENENINNN